MLQHVVQSSPNAPQCSPLCLHQPLPIPTLFVSDPPSSPSGAQCDATGTKCLVCNGSRSAPTGVTDGRCALPCKQLYGIGCLRCNQTACLATDAKYAQGASLHLG